MRQRATTALILSGGGARAAYQVGVLRALAHMKTQWEAAVDVGAVNALSGSPSRDSERAVSPFGIVVGTSAGAINSAALATQPWRRNQRPWASCQACAAARHIPA